MSPTDTAPGYEMDSNWNVRERYEQLPGGSLFTVRNTTLSSTSNVYSLVNLHGDTMATVDGTGAQTGTFTYEPFGKTTSATTPDNANGKADFDYLGQYQKQTETLYTNQPQIMGARIYLANMGRFVQPDPIEGGNENAYVYPPDPVNENDISGKCPMCVLALPLLYEALNLLSEDPAATGFRGYTVHGLDQAISRGGHGVSVRAIREAIRNPKKLIQQKHPKGDTLKHVGENAVVVLNKARKIVTTWATNRQGHRY